MAERGMGPVHGADGNPQCPCRGRPGRGAGNSAPRSEPCLASSAWGARGLGSLTACGKAAGGTRAAPGRGCSPSLPESRWEVSLPTQPAPGISRMFRAMNCHSSLVARAGRLLLSFPGSCRPSALPRHVCWKGYLAHVSQQRPGARSGSGLIAAQTPRNYRLATDSRRAGRGGRCRWAHVFWFSSGVHRQGQAICWRFILWIPSARAHRRGLRRQTSVSGVSL